MQPATARCDGVHFGYATAAGEVHALRGVDLEVRSGELTLLTGSSGSGKSTLLNVLAGLEQASQGRVEVLGKTLNSMSASERAALRLNHIGMVFQDNNLIAQFTAAENVELVLGCQGSPQPAEAARRLLGEVDMEELADRRAGAMSGGQRQRVGIARALAGDRELLLCDEPTGSLDRANSLTLFETLKRLAHDEGVAVLVATHDPEAVAFADRHLVIVDGLLACK